MQYSILAILAAATAVVASPQGWGPDPGPQILSGGQCEPDGLNHCLNDNRAWGCVQLAGPNCVDQTKQCDYQCGSNGFRYAYQKNSSPDNTCVCSNDDASQPLQYWGWGGRNRGW